MQSSIYHINKGVGRPVVFKGLVAQYIWFLGGGLVALLILFSILYITGVNPYICIAVTLALGAGLVMYVYRLSNTYGEHGMMKKLARKKVPRLIRCNSRRLFSLTPTPLRTERG